MGTVAKTNPIPTHSTHNLIYPNLELPKRLRSFQVQVPMNRHAEEIPPMAQAMAWVSRITSLSMEMALPALGGWYLDQKWGTNFLMAIGAVFGFVLGGWHLMVMVKVINPKIPNPSNPSTPQPPSDQAPSP